MAVSGSAVEENASGTEKAGSEEEECCSSANKDGGGRWPRFESVVRSIAPKRSGKEDVSTLLIYVLSTMRPRLIYPSERGVVAKG
jgi:hypothetical protein